MKFSGKLRKSVFRTSNGIQVEKVLMEPDRGHGEIAAI